MKEPDLTRETPAPAEPMPEPQTVDIEYQRSEKLQAALYRIAEIASAAQDMQEFYAEIHHIVGELMYADNFYIVLYDEGRQQINWPRGRGGRGLARPPRVEPIGESRASPPTCSVSAAPCCSSRTI